MAGNIFLKELASTGITITSTGGSTTTGSITSAGTLDMRSGGTSGALEPINGYFQLSGQITTITGITSGTPIADLYLVPSLDGGTTYATVDSTAGAGVAPYVTRFGTFTNTLATFVTLTTYTWVTGVAECFPTIFTVYIIGRSGQTLNANWTLKFYPSMAQYT